MKNRLILIFLLLNATLFLAEAKSISASEALKVAREFFSKNSSSGTKAGISLKITSTSLDYEESMTKSQEDDPTFYVVSSSNGFVIVAADDFAYPVLAYSFDRSCDGKLNVAAAKWMTFLSQQIKLGRKEKLTASSQISKQWETLSGYGTNQKLLVTAEWGQQAPYYNQCPIYNGQRCLTGCIATAIAELMRFYKKPSAGTGTAPSYSYMLGVDQVTIPARKLSSYNWDKMPMTTSEYQTTEQNDAVATLISDIGVANGMLYSPSVSISRYKLEVLNQYFGFNEECGFKSRDYYSDNEWIAMLHKEIDNQRPVLYSAQDDNGNGGHAFLLDGYSDNNYFHVNWGWDGYQNGNFALSALNPGDYKFNSYHFAVFPLKQKDESQEEIGDDWLTLYTSLRANTQNFTTGTYFVLQSQTLNNYLKSFSGDLAYILFDADGQFKELLYSTSKKSSPIKYNYIFYMYPNIAINSNIEQGDVIRLCERESSEDSWKWIRHCPKDSINEIHVSKYEDESVGKQVSFEYDMDNGKIYISLVNSSITVTLFDKDEREITDIISKSEKKVTIDVAELSSDIYTIVLADGMAFKKINFNLKEE